MTPKQLPPAAVGLITGTLLALCGAVLIAVVTVLRATYEVADRADGRTHDAYRWMWVLIAIDLFVAFVMGVQSARRTRAIYARQR